MGARLLTRWINDPLISKKEIERIFAVEELYNNIILRGSIIEILKKIYDIERIAGKVAFRKYKRERYDIIKKFYKISTRT